MPHLNLQQVNTRTFLGKAVADNYPIDKKETLRTIRDMYQDNPAAVEAMIGAANVKALRLKK